MCQTRTGRFGSAAVLASPAGLSTRQLCIDTTGLKPAGQRSCGTGIGLSVGRYADGQRPGGTIVIGSYGAYFDTRVDGLGIEQVLTAPRSPWQNPFVERIIGSIRRECLDHVIVLDERHLKRILRKYVDYYHSCRTHLSLEKDAPEPRRVESPAMGKVRAIPKVGGLHHYYTRHAAA